MRWFIRSSALGIPAGRASPTIPRGSPSPRGIFQRFGTPGDERDNNDYGDLRLRPFSPCIDTGDGSAVPDGIVVDLVGLPRFVDDIWMPDRSSPPVDMGAYEFQGNSCLADFNNDATLNSQDVFDFLSGFFVGCA